MGDWREWLQRKVLGVPVLYILAGVAVIALIYALRMQPSAPEEEIEGEPEAGDSEFDDSDAQPVFIANPPTSTVTPPPAQEDNNELWARRAISWLISTSDTTLQEATNAITKYLNEEDLNQNEAVLRDKAVKQFGLPPEGLLRSGTGGYRGPFSSQGVPPTTHTVRNKNDDTFRELAKGYYGRTDAAVLGLLRAANTTMNEPFSAGQRVTIPKRVNPRYFKATAAVRTLTAIAAKNATEQSEILALNPGMRFPVKVGTRVRVQ